MIIYLTTTKLAERRYALYSELWGLRRQLDRTAQEISDLTDRLRQIQPSGIRTRVSKKMFRVQRTLENKLSDKQAFSQTLKREAEQKRGEVIEIEQRLRVIYSEAGKGNITDPSVGVAVIPQLGHELAARKDDYEYDLFISHATEDKSSTVRPLVQKLENLGLRVWYDETELSIGDSLRQCIDRGLSRSRYGLVVLSEHFLTKKWTRYELDSLVALEIEKGKVILPIWHGITKDQLLSVSPKLADKVALNTKTTTLDDIALEIAIAVMENR